MKPMTKKHRDASKARDSHKHFIKFVTTQDEVASTPKFESHKFNRAVSRVQNSDMVDISFESEEVLKPALRLHPEATAFLFFIDGCSKNLLFYLLLKKVDLRNCEYLFNINVIREFKSMSNDYFNKEYSETTISQAHRKLVDHHITCNKNTGCYMINPLLFGGHSNDTRRNLVNIYSNLLISKDNQDRFYPKYRCA